VSLTGNVTGRWDFFANSIRNLAEAPIDCADDTVITVRDFHRACAAWREVERGSPDRHFSVDYKAGFKAGYVDYLDAGGSGEPPGVPPYRYRLSCYQNPAGQQAIRDWYTGFRHGADVARSSG
jgi:hypothetical protein